MTRSRKLAAAAAALLLATGATAFAIYRAGEHEVRLEISTRSGTVSRVQWNVANEQHSVGGGLPTPWSAALTVPQPGGLVTLAAITSETDVVTCRITVDGTSAAESTAHRATGCTAILS